MKTRNSAKSKGATNTMPSPADTETEPQTAAAETVPNRGNNRNEKGVSKKSKKISKSARSNRARGKKNTQEQDDDLIKCPLCFEVYTYSYFGVHILHHVTRKCSICKKRIEREAFADHLHKHEQEEYACPVCKAIFTIKDLQAHLGEHPDVFTPQLMSTMLMM